MPSLTQHPNPNPSPNPNVPIKKRRSSLPDLWQKLHHLQQADYLAITNNGDPFSRLPDQLLSLILSKLSFSYHGCISLVCKRWCILHSQHTHQLTILDWSFLLSGRLITRFHNLVEVNLVPSCFKTHVGCGVLLSNQLGSIQVDTELICDGLVGTDEVLCSDMIDAGLKVLSSGCPKLKKLVLVNPSEVGLAYLAERCDLLQEIEVYCCKDRTLRSVSGIQNLQILKLNSSVDGLFDSGVTDIGLTIVAQGCLRLNKLELSGCEGSYDGIKAIGQCCRMLEEFIICNHKMDGGWLSALSYCANLKTLRIKSCEVIDSCPDPVEYLGQCLTIEELFLERCHVKDKDSLKALFIVCQSVREISFADCWGLEDDIFRYAAVCRRVKSLSLQGCSLLTTQGLDSVVQTWKELQTLKVVSCNNIKDTEITPELATLFSTLKELKWRPSTKSLLAPGLAGAGIGKKGSRFFKRMMLMVDKRK